MTTGCLVAAVAVCMAIAWTLRAVPFAVPRPPQDSAFLEHVRLRMPLRIMVVLVVYR